MAEGDITIKEVARVSQKQTSSEMSCSTPNKLHHNDDESSNDSTSLQIVVPDSVRNRQNSLPFDIDREMENDIEMALETKQRKTNLTVKNVKSILRYVIENENVLAMINSAIKRPELDVEPKITRSIARQLREENQIIWPLSPIPVSAPDLIEKEHLVLLQGELHEEEDDEEYRPTLDDIDFSDDETGRHSVGTSSIDTSTAGRYLESFDARLLDDSIHDAIIPQTSDIQFKTNSPFKKPVELKKPESIGQRTRSKYSLSSTPLEAIEQAFVPPDITTDMYDFKCDDQEWENFLKEFMQPLPVENVDPDEDDDPEYNAMAEVEQIDREELRRDKAVKVSRAEVRKLMEELTEGAAAEEASSDDEEEEPSAVSTPILFPRQINTEKLPPRPRHQVISITSVQLQILAQQIRQHVQLCTQSFLQVHCHPIFYKNAAPYKQMLAYFLELSEYNKKSIVNFCNLKKCFMLVEEWEKLLMTSKGKNIICHMEKDVLLSQEAKKQKLLHYSKFHPILMHILSKSNLFTYPQLLPNVPFVEYSNKARTTFVNGEDLLITTGLEQMLSYLTTQPPEKGHRGPILAASELIHKLMMPTKLAKQIYNRVRTMRNVVGHPIWYFFKHNSAPIVNHKILPFESIAPIQMDPALLPPFWSEYMNHLKKCSKCQNSVTNTNCRTWPKRS